MDPMMWKRSMMGACLLAVLVAACNSPQDDADRSTDDTIASAVEQAAEDKASRADSTTDEVPNELLEKLIDDLMSNNAAARIDIEVLRAESLIWSDGSLGCGKAGEMYTQALVPGYRVILSHAGRQFDYRATEKGFFRLCERPTLAAPGEEDKPAAQ